MSLDHRPKKLMSTHAEERESYTKVLHEQGQRNHGRQNPVDGMRRTQPTFSSKTWGYDYRCSRCSEASTDLPDTQLATLSLRRCELGSRQPQGNGSDAQEPEHTCWPNLQLSSSEVERRLGCKTITMSDAQRHRRLGTRCPRELENSELYSSTIILREAVNETMLARFGRLPCNSTIMHDAKHPAAQDRGSAAQYQRLPAYLQDLSAAHQYLNHVIPEDAAIISTFAFWCCNVVEGTPSSTRSGGRGTQRNFGVRGLSGYQTSDAHDARASSQL